MTQLLQSAIQFQGMEIVLDTLHRIASYNYFHRHITILKVRAMYLCPHRPKSISLKHMSIFIGISHNLSVLCMTRIDCFTCDELDRQCENNKKFCCQSLTSSFLITTVHCTCILCGISTLFVIFVVSLCSYIG